MTQPIMFGLITLAFHIQQTISPVTTYCVYVTEAASSRSKKKKKSIETRFCSAALHGLASRDPNDEKETMLSPFHTSQNRVKTLFFHLLITHGEPLHQEYSMQK